ncbi:hypothetical protein FOA52_005186 [Chlamydomonas sp. UWO 241]|nr:hypothetical protein FOA52_005186 [Chlamydomonas sp. UWO 241]
MPRRQDGESGRMGSSDAFKDSAGASNQVVTVTRAPRTRNDSSGLPPCSSSGWSQGCADSGEHTDRPAYGKHERDEGAVGYGVDGNCGAGPCPSAGEPDGGGGGGGAAGRTTGGGAATVQAMCAEGTGGMGGMGLDPGVPLEARVDGMGGVANGDDPHMQQQEQQQEQQQQEQEEKQEEQGQQPQQQQPQQQQEQQQQEQQQQQQYGQWTPVDGGGGDASAAAATMAGFGLDPQSIALAMSAGIADASTAAAFSATIQQLMNDPQAAAAAAAAISDPEQLRALSQLAQVGQSPGGSGSFSALIAAVLGIGGGGGGEGRAAKKPRKHAAGAGGAGGGGGGDGAHPVGGNWMRRFHELAYLADKISVDEARCLNTLLTLNVQWENMPCDMTEKLSNEPAAIEVPSTANVGVLRRAICRTLGGHLTPSTLRLSPGRELLFDTPEDPSLASLGITDGSTILMDATCHAIPHFGDVPASGSMQLAVVDGYEGGGVLGFHLSGAKGGTKERFTLSEMYSLVEGMEVHGLKWAKIHKEYRDLENKSQGDLKDKWRNWQRNVANGWQTARVYMPDDLKARIAKIVIEYNTVHQAPDGQHMLTSGDDNNNGNNNNNNIAAGFPPLHGMNTSDMAAGFPSLQSPYYPPSTLKTPIPTRTM